METIVLKNKKKINWKKVIIISCICVLIAVIVGLYAGFRITYEYYQINIDGTYTTIGTATQNDLIDRAIVEKVREVKQEGFQIADYNLDTLVKKRLIIIKRQKKDDTSTYDAIKDKVYVIVAANKLDLDGETYYFERHLGYITLSKLREINKNLNTIYLEGTYINRDWLLSEQEAETLIDTYSKKIKK